jgi:hypothetical protein
MQIPFGRGNGLHNWPGSLPNREAAVLVHPPLRQPGHEDRRLIARTAARVIGPAAPFAATPVEARKQMETSKYPQLRGFFERDGRLRS